MPSARIKYIVSSSESERGYGAENLLEGPNKRTKWKGLASVEQNVVVLQLEREYVITSIDVGNEFSALIEVLVAKSCEKQQNYYTIVPSTSFMNSMESRSEKNGNSVRVFSDCDMVPSVAKQKWDLVKVVCSQPFNKNLSYGLSFVNIVVDDGDSLRSQKQILPKIPLKLKKIEDDSKFLDAGEMFKNRRVFLSDPEKATSSALETTAKDFSKPVKRQGDIATKVSPKDMYALRASLLKKKKPDIPKQVDENDPFAGSAPSSSTASGLFFKKLDSMKSNDFKTPDGGDEKPVVPFDQLLQGVQFCLSGYENPLRSILREKALEMGAKYSIDWTPGCTHLVSAFPNTPKARQVRSKGKIITGKWIQMCYSSKKRLPEEKFLCR